MLSKRDDQRGFTLVELSVAMTLMLLVSGAILAALESGTNAERRASTRIDDSQAVRVVLTQLARDVRNASRLSYLPFDAPSMHVVDELDLWPPTSPNPVVWTYDPAHHVLQRAVNNTPGVSISSLTNADGTVFQLLAADGSDLLADASASGNDFGACTAVVAVSVTSAAHPPSQPFTESAHAPFAPPGVDRRGCP